MPGPAPGTVRATGRASARMGGQPSRVLAVSTSEGWQAAGLLVCLGLLDSERLREAARKTLAAGAGCKRIP